MSNFFKEASSEKNSVFGYVLGVNLNLLTLRCSTKKTNARPFYNDTKLHLLCQNGEAFSKCESVNPWKM